MKKGKLNVYRISWDVRKTSQFSKVESFRWRWQIIMHRTCIISSWQVYKTRRGARRAMLAVAKDLGIDLENTTAIKPR